MILTVFLLSDLENITFMKLTVPRFDNAQLLVVGDVMLDRYWHGVTGRVSPEAPVPVVKVDHTEDRPGGAANVALNVAALGAGVSLLGTIGNDEAAQALLARLQAASIHCDFHQSQQHPTITKLRVISRHQQLLRMDFEEAFAAEDVQPLQEKTRQYLPQVAALVLSDYNKGVLSDPQPLIQMAIELGVPVLVDPKGNEFTRYRGATLLTPNIAEFEAVMGHCKSEQQLLKKGLQLIQQLNLEALLVTRGELGMTLIRPDGPELHLPARAREVFDVTGAGDTVIAVLATALAAGVALPEAVAQANIAAGLAVAKLGTAAISAPELRWAVQKEQGFERGVVSLEQLLIVVQEAKSQGEKIVMTNGCFDIIHAGHVGYLEQARSQGDRLIVAVNDDESVKRLKGEGRPINPVDRRMTVLAGLEAVDWVLAFNDDTPEELLKALQPDVLVKGGDYDKQGVVGWQLVEAYGGRVEVLDLWDNCSTTAIVDKIQAPS